MLFVLFVLLLRVEALMVNFLLTFIFARLLVIRREVKLR